MDSETKIKHVIRGELLFAGLRFIGSNSFGF